MIAAPVGERLPPIRRAASWVSRQRRWAPEIVAALLASIPAWSTVKGVDWAAQVYRVGFFKTEGWAPFDTSWYGGLYPISYSSIFPFIASHFTVGVVAMFSSATAVYGFRRVVRERFGVRSPWAAACFVITTAMEVAVGQLPFMLGIALATLTFAFARSRWWPLTILTALACSCASPVAGLFCGLAAVAWMVTSPLYRRRAAALTAAAGAPLLVSMAFFPQLGKFPFSADDLLFIGVVAAVIHVALPGRLPTLRAGLGIYLAGAVLCFVVPNALGDNVTRLATAIGVPLVAVVWWVRHDKRRLAFLAVPLVFWQLIPMATSVSASTSDPSQSEAYFQPLLDQLTTLSSTPQRIEVVPTRDHWEAAWVAPHWPLARGWFRQADLQHNSLFYETAAVTPTSYESWLRSTGVRWVAVPDVRLDWSARDEIAVIQSAPSYLKPIWHDAHWQLFAVDGEPSMVDGPATLQSLGAADLMLSFHSAGTALVRVRYTREWTVVVGSACIQETPDAWTSVTAPGPGIVEMKAAMLSKNVDACP